jgi:hypothetical protein
MEAVTEVPPLLMQAAEAECRDAKRSLLSARAQMQVPPEPFAKASAQRAPRATAADGRPLNALKAPRARQSLGSSNETHTNRLRRA